MPALRPTTRPVSAPPRVVWSDLAPPRPAVPQPLAARAAPQLAVPAEQVRAYRQPLAADAAAAAPERPSRRASGRVRDAAPSRLSYRMHRMWLTPVYRALFRVGVPAFASVFAIGLFLSDTGRREALLGTGNDAIRAIQERPEFMVNLMAINGASPELGEEIRTILPVNFPVSSFDLDLEVLRQEVVALGAVAAADLRVKPGGILEVRIDERRPAILWRGDQGLVLLDQAGHRVSRLDSRLERPDLPIIAGDAADQAVPEALKLIEVAQPVAARLRGLVRMGERRWDVVLDNGQRILLPEDGAVEALQRVMALAIAEDMLSRDVTVVDMRFGDRPTLRLSPGALEELRRGQTYLTGASGQ